MGHLLETVNPEAARAISQEPSPVRQGVMAPIGETVLYYCRPGEGRQGRAAAPMIVTKHLNDGRIGGVVIFDANDFLDVPGVWFRSDGNPWPAWGWRDGPPVMVAPRDVDVIDVRSPGHIVQEDRSPPMLRDDLERLIENANTNIHSMATRLDALNRLMHEKDAVLAAREAIFRQQANTISTLGQRILVLEQELGVGEFAQPAKAPAPKRKAKPSAKGRT